MHKSGSLSTPLLAALVRRLFVARGFTASSSSKCRRRRMGTCGSVPLLTLFRRVLPASRFNACLHESYGIQQCAPRRGPGLSRPAGHVHVCVVREQTWQWGSVRSLAVSVTCCEMEQSAFTIVPFACDTARKTGWSEWWWCS